LFSFQFPETKIKPWEKQKPAGMTSGFRKKSIVQKTHRCQRKCQATRFGMAAIIGLVGLTNISE